MEEVLTRRFTHGLREQEEGKELGGFTVFPDLILMDGGRGQVNIAEEVLQKLPQSISQNENEQFEERLLNMMKQRESMSSIVFGKNIAVPHPLKAVGSKHHFAVAIVKNGVKWDEQYLSIKIIFLMSMSIHDNDGLPELTSAIVDLVDNPKLQEQMLACQSFDEFKKIFLTI